MFFRSLTLFLRDTSGASFIYIAFMLTVLAGVTALSVEYGNALRVRAQLQSTAELAAIAAANALPDETAARTAAISYAETNLPIAQNGNVLASSDVEFGNWDVSTKAFTVSATPTNAVRVTTRRSAANNNALGAGFGAIFGTTEFNLSRSAVASIGTSPACMIALDPTSSQAMEVNSNAQVNITNCEVHVASTSGSALYTDSNAQINADRICVAGGYSENSRADATPDPETSCTPPSDPFAHLAEPTFVGCTESSSVKVDSADRTFTPIGSNPYIFCEDLEITSNVTVTFDPGTYVLQKKFLVDSNAAISGDGVFFFLSGSDAEMQIDSNSTVTLTPQTTGAYAGILFYADDANTNNHKFDSNAAAVIDGVFYFPNASLEFNSNSTIGSGSNCTQFVANTIYLDSNTNINFAADLENCPQYSTLGGAGIALRQ